MRFLCEHCCEEPGTPVPLQAQTEQNLPVLEKIQSGRCQLDSIQEEEEDDNLEEEIDIFLLAQSTGCTLSTASNISSGSPRTISRLSLHEEPRGEHQD